MPHGRIVKVRAIRRNSAGERMEAPEETSLVQKLSELDEDAWGLFCRTHARTLFTFVRCHFGWQSDAGTPVVQFKLARTHSGSAS